MNNPQAKREKDTELMEVHFRLQEQGKRLADCIDRLRVIGNKLSDDSSCPSGQKAPEPKVEIILPGLIMSLNNDIEGFHHLINGFEEILSKITPLI